MSKSRAARVLPQQVLASIDRVLEPNKYRRAKGPGICSVRTAQIRRTEVRLAFATLWELGYQIRKPENLAQKHIEALVSHWDGEDASASIIHQRLSILRTFCAWCGRRDVVLDTDTYLPAERIVRTTIVTASKAWNAAGVDADILVLEAESIDVRLGAMLAMQHYFGLRVKESIELRPSHSLVDGGFAIEIYQGTKGGRLRRVAIATEQQRVVFDRVREVAAEHGSGRLRWPGTTWRQAQSRYYRLVRKLGVSRGELGITSHGLRHGFAQRMYRAVSGHATPVEGGALGRISRGEHLAASLETSRALGHGRAQVGGTYYGSYGHALRGADGQGERNGSV